MGCGASKEDWPTEAPGAPAEVLPTLSDPQESKLEPGPGSELGSQLGPGLWSKLESGPGSELGSQLGPGLWSKLESGPGSELGSQLGSGLGQGPESGLSSPMPLTTEDESLPTYGSEFEMSAASQNSQQPPRCRVVRKVKRKKGKGARPQEGPESQPPAD